MNLKVNNRAILGNHHLKTTEMRQHKQQDQNNFVLVIVCYRFKNNCIPCNYNVFKHKLSQTLHLKFLISHDLIQSIDWSIRCDVIYFRVVFFHLCQSVYEILQTAVRSPMHGVFSNLQSRHCSLRLLNRSRRVHGFPS